MLSWLGLRKRKPAASPAEAMQSDAPDPQPATPPEPEPASPSAVTTTEAVSDTPPASTLAQPGKHAPEIAPEIPRATPAELLAPEPPTVAPESAIPETSPTDSAPAFPLPEPQTPQASDPESPRRLLETLIANARIAEAETVFAQLAPDLDQEWYLRSGLALARRRMDHIGALAFATRLQQAATPAPASFGAASFALRALKRPREALGHAEAGLKLFPKATGLLQEAAQAAEAADDTERAYASWAALRAAQPNAADGYVGAVQLSVRKQQPEITRTLLEEGLAAFPENRKLRLAAARHAVRSQLWEDAATHWNVLTSQFPDEAPLALEAAVSFIGSRAGRRRRMPQVFAQLTALHQRFPVFAPAYAAHVKALREIGQLDAAETQGRAWLERFPGNQDLAIACARVAEEQGRLADAVATLQAARDHAGQAKAQPGLLLEVAYSRILSLAGQNEAAERVIDAALARFPGDIRVIEQHIALATRRGDFAEAAVRTGRLAQQYPENAAIARLGRKLQTLQQDANPHAGAAAASPVTEADSLAGFFTIFESLGGTTSGCEFGLVQRRFGAEPLGLLRWGNITIAGLANGLRQRFEGLGEPENTRIVVQRASANHREYFLYDDRYTYWTHTFINADDAPADKVLKQSLRRLHFLRGKLVEDLTQADKIFVFKMPRDEGRASLQELYGALSGYAGHATLLAVTLEDDKHPRGTVEMLQPGLFLGRAGMFMDAGNDEERGIDADLWRRLCEQVVGWRNESQTAAALATT